MTKQSRIDKGLYWYRAWSLVEGCYPVSEGCRNCWAASQAHMRQNHPNESIRQANTGLTVGLACSTAIFAFGVIFWICPLG